MSPAFHVGTFLFFLCFHIFSEHLCYYMKEFKLVFTAVYYLIIIV